MTRRERRAFLTSLSDDERKQIDWWLIAEARDKQLPPVGDWLYWLIMTGRGWGKTRTGSGWVNDKAWTMLGSKGGLVGESVNDVRNIMIEQGPSALLNVAPPWFRPRYFPAKRQLIWPNGTIATLYSGDKPEQLRGPQFHWLWLDELAKYLYAQEVYDQLEFTLRLEYLTNNHERVPPQCLITTTPRPIECIKSLVSDQDCVVTTGSTFENAANLSAKRLARLKTTAYCALAWGSRSRGRADGGGKSAFLWILGDRTYPGSIEYNRVDPDDVPQLIRVVVGVDPPGSTAECGIVAAGLGLDGNAYLLNDASVEGSPPEWSLAVFRCYQRVRAGEIVAEKNQGGDMVEHTIKTVEVDGQFIGKNLPVTLVWASRGKQTRAQPISVLYNNNRVKHAGVFKDLEGQMTTWIPGMKSPDRMDAMVWALSALFFDEIESEEPGRGLAVRGNR